MNHSVRLFHIQVDNFINLGLSPKTALMIMAFMFFEAAATLYPFIR